MRDREATTTIRLLAERQHGIVARSQLLRNGLSRQLVEARVEAGILVPVYDGVFAVGHGKLGLSATWLAAVFASGPGCSALAWQCR